LPALGTADTPYPYLSLLPQAKVEAVLQRHLADRGVDIEWGVRLRHCTSGSNETLAQATLDDGRTIRAGYVVGCDGAESTVRSAVGIGSRGGRYRWPVTLADLDMTGDLAPDGLHVFVGRYGMAFIGRVGEYAPWRMLATDPGAVAVAEGTLGEGVLGAGVLAESGWPSGLLAEAGIDAGPPAWAVALPQRFALAHDYRRGRVFLAGDAAHVHSPGGGQGLNTGIGDASNLGWKLALAVRGLAGEPLLDSYQAERRPLARLLVALTSLVYVGESSANPLVAMVRRLAPVLVGPLAAHLPAASRWALRVIGQLTYGYQPGPAVREAMPPLRRGPRPGRRVPDTPLEIDGRPTTLHEVIAEPGLHLIASGWSPTSLDGLNDLMPGRLRAHRAATLLDGRPGRGYCLIRPDGYVGLRGAGDGPDAVRRYLRAWC
jgi:2-polyprenyl-6-methoxyphenol hydroxylase-like FAD-dependent oxidoreductase